MPTITPTSERVTLHTKPDVNERIHRQSERNIDYYRHHPDQIPARLEELDREWDVERALETQFATLSVFGTVMSVLSKNRKWLILNAVTGWFMLQHAIQGWCPPAPVYRRLGVRTAKEIEQERCELKRILEK